MSPVLSSTFTAGFPIRRRAPLSSASLFPVCPERGPNTRTQERAPLSGPGSIVPDIAPYKSSADCPPPTPAPCGDPLRDSQDFRKDAALAATDHEPGAAPNGIAPLVGIARLASISLSAPSRRKSEQRPEYFLLPVKSILTRCQSSRVPFDWTINPYRGCEFACKYCYARYTHEFMELDGLAFETKILVKKDAAVLLTREIATKYSFASGHEGAPEHICIGTATDPYQPAEREFGITRACLQELARHDGLSVSITTKS